MFRNRPELKFAVIALVTGIVILFFGTKVADPYSQSIYANGGVSLVGLAVALWIVNIYLDRRSRSAAKHALFELVGESLSEINNRFVGYAHDHFGQQKFDDLTAVFLRNERKATALSREQRSELWKLVQENRSSLDPLIDQLDGELKELCGLVGWSFDSRILYIAISCRAAIAKYVRYKSGATDDDVKIVCENFLETVLLSSELFKEINPRP